MKKNLPLALMLSLLVLAAPAMAQTWTEGGSGWLPFGDLWAWAQYYGLTIFGW